MDFDYCEKIAAYTEAGGGIFDNTVTCSFEENDRQLVLKMTNEQHVPQLHDPQVAVKSITNAAATAKLMSIPAKQIELLKNDLEADVLQILASEHIVRLTGRRSAVQDSLF